MGRIYLGIVLALCLLAVSCSSSKSTTTTAPGGSTGFQITSPQTNPAIDVGQSVPLTANQSALWSLQSSTNNKAAGSLSNTTTAATTVTYTAPASVTIPTEVLVVATSSSDNTQSASIGVAINLPPTVASGFLSGNQSCQYDPIIRIGSSNGTAGSVYPTSGNPPVVSGGTGPYSWSVSSGSLPTGVTLNWAATTVPPSPSSAYLSGTPLSTGCFPIALQVTDGTGVSATSPTYYVIITPPALKIQVPNYTDAYTGIPYPPTAFSVSGGSPPYLSWSVLNPVSLPPGMNLSPSAQNSSAVSLTGTPNGSDSLTTGGPYQPSLQVIDSQTPYPAFGSVQLNIYQWANLPSSACAPADSANGTTTITTNSTGMNGSYAFLLRGFDLSGPVVIAGNFTTDGAGNISGGIEDAMRTTGSETGVAITGGSYTILQQSNSPSGSATFAESGCVSLTTSTGTNTFSISLGGCSTGSEVATTGACVADSQGAPGIFTTGRLIEFDDNTGAGTRASGIVRLQDSSTLSSGLSGPYAFGLSGFDFAGKRFAAAGSFSAGSGTMQSIAADVNDAGVLQPAITGGAGTFTAASNGRGTGAMTSGTESLNFAFYPVSAQEVLLTTTGTPSSTNPIITGEAITSAGPYSVASLQNSHMFHTAGLSPAGPDANIGVLSFDGVSSFTGTQYEDQAGTLGTTSLSGAYAVDSTTGRLSFIASVTNPQSLGDHPLVGYVVPVPANLTRQNCARLSSCVTGFLLSTDTSAQSGQLEFQTPSTAPPPPFSSLHVSGYYFYGTDESLDSSTALFAGAASANPNGTHFAEIQSASYPNSAYCQQPICALLIPNQTLATSATYSVNTNGTGTIGGETVSVTNGNVIYYIDESPLNAHPSVIVVEQ